MKTDWTPKERKQASELREVLAQAAERGRYHARLEAAVAAMPYPPLREEGEFEAIASDELLYGCARVLVRPTKTYPKERIELRVREAR